MSAIGAFESVEAENAFMRTEIAKLHEDIEALQHEAENQMNRIQELEDTVRYVAEHPRAYEGIRRCVQLTKEKEK